MKGPWIEQADNILIWLFWAWIIGVVTLAAVVGLVTAVL